MKRGDFIKSIFLAGVGLATMPNDFLLPEKKVRELPTSGYLILDGDLCAGDLLSHKNQKTLLATTIIRLGKQKVFVRNIRLEVIKISVGDKLVNMRTKKEIIVLEIE